MESGRPSRTAWRAAHARARHQADPQRIFTDPLASTILHVEPDALTPLPDDPVARHNIRFLAARSRFAEDSLASAVTAGTRQLVVLGAGLDTFACRHTHPGLTVFEVDHPDTQAWKRQQLAAAGIAVPPSLAFAPLDFERGTLAEALDAAGLDRTRAAFFIWLGVTPYLTRDAVLATLRFVAGHTAPVQVVFDYYSEPSPAMAPEPAPRTRPPRGRWQSWASPGSATSPRKASPVSCVRWSWTTSRTTRAPACSPVTSASRRPTPMPSAVM